MESLYLFIPIAGVFLIVAVAVFFWAVRSGQFEDLNTEGKRILFDEIERQPEADLNSENDMNNDREASTPENIPPSTPPREK